MTKTTVTVPANGGPVEAVSTIESVPYWTRSRRKTGKIFVMKQYVTMGMGSTAHHSSYVA